MVYYKKNKNGTILELSYSSFEKTDSNQVNKQTLLIFNF
jgi:hypothetical protein